MELLVDSTAATKIIILAMDTFCTTHFFPWRNTEYTFIWQDDPITNQRILLKIENPQGEKVTFLNDSRDIIEIGRIIHEFNNMKPEFP
jgi:hypothetical protein